MATLILQIYKSECVCLRMSYVSNIIELNLMYIKKKKKHWLFQANYAQISHSKDKGLTPLVKI